MAWLETRKLSYDLDTFQSTRERFRALSWRLEEADQTLAGALEHLRETWDTAAGRKFIQDFDAEWSDNAKQFSEAAALIADMLGNAITQYQPITEEIKQLSI